MNDSQIKALVKEGIPCLKSIGDGLYIRIADSGKPFWVFRYTFRGKRKQLFLGSYGKAADDLGLRDAKDAAALKRLELNQGLDPLTVERDKHKSHFVSVDDVAQDWLRDCERRLENPQIPKRVYLKDIKGVLGDLPIREVTAKDVLFLVRQINDSGRPTIANDALVYCKQIFNQAVKLGSAEVNPALVISTKDAGGAEKSRIRALSLSELRTISSKLKYHYDIFTRDNYLAFYLLLLFGVRKTELIAARWDEFDFDKQIWNLPAQRTKTRVGVQIPLPSSCLQVFDELRVRACGSNFVFPSRRKSRRREYISDDTLNHALQKMFGINGKDGQPRNILGDAGIEHFVIHDLRRTFRSLLAEYGVAPHIAERCLNHKIKGVEGIYDRYDYFEERRDAIEKHSEMVQFFL